MSSKHQPSFQLLTGHQSRSNACGNAEQSAGRRAPWCRPRSPGSVEQPLREQSGRSRKGLWSARGNKPCQNCKRSRRARRSRPACSDGINKPAYLDGNTLWRRSEQFQLVIQHSGNDRVYDMSGRDDGMRKNSVAAVQSERPACAFLEPC
jgi:hypothetical protein